MSGTGNGYDHAGAASFFPTLKTELVYCEDYQTREESRRSIFQYLEVFYHRERRHWALNYMSPMNFEQLPKAA